jgi:hypothetical protein
MARRAPKTAWTDTDFGHELTCEVVSCESLDRCQPGHGPKGA